MKHKTHCFPTLCIISQMNIKKDSEEMKVAMKSTPSILPEAKTLVINVIIKRLLLVVLFIITIKYAVFDLSYAMSGVIGAVDNSPSKGMFNFLFFSGVILLI